MEEKGLREAAISWKGAEDRAEEEEYTDTTRQKQKHEQEHKQKQLEAGGS
jgi:hypothetical protein